jgi:hypothetical protein
VVGLSWLAAVAAFPGILAIAAIGQGLGSVVGGCVWIGASLPLDRQVWALVNQPVINFSSLPAASGYWLGSLALPLAVAAATPGLLHRVRSLTVQLHAIQWSWAASVVALAWLPVLDLDDGHIARWLALQDHGPAAIAWLPAAAACLGLLPAGRLLALARRRQPNLRRRSRVALVVCHLAMPTACWIAVATMAAESLQPMAVAAAALPSMAVLVLAGTRFPAPYAWPLAEPRLRGVAATLLTAALTVVAVWAMGRPIGSGRAAVLWATATATNNIRPWMITVPVTSPVAPEPPGSSGQPETAEDS